MFLYEFALIWNDDKQEDHNEEAIKITFDNKSRRLSRWFVSNQKTDEWDEKKFNQLHITIVLLLFFMYICHVIASPFIKFINDQAFNNGEFKPELKI